MNEFEARLHLGRVVRELLLDMMDDGSAPDAEYRELEDAANEVVDALFEDLDLQVVSVEAPFVTVRLNLGAQEGPEVSP